MGIEVLKSAIPDYAKDLRLNLSVLTTSSLDPAAAWGSAYTAALISKNTVVKEAILEDAEPHLSAEQVEGCKAAAAIMSMNNVWYKFNDLVSDPEIKGLPAKLRMNVMMSHGGIGPVLFETYSLSASVVNACGTCVDAHAAQLRKHGVSAQHIADVGRIASVVKAVSDTLGFDAGAPSS
jgi:lipoyl-dependent peroxiredoxin subunit D